ncbi:DUF4153 domain-containing protein [Haloimpatiens sp. FM7315]|uniref:DUF4153 domain-containing protein n=1 Tax=Haloimpatiens sp. FM7315 TaxID=3298609 RepID=UPI00370C9C88
MDGSLLKKDDKRKNDLLKLDDPKEGFNKDKIKREMLIYSFAFGILFDYFFIWDSFGINLTLFNFAMLAVLIVIIYPCVNFKNKLSYIFLIPYLLLSLSYSIYTNEVFRFLNLLLLPFLLISYIMCIKSDEISINLSFIKNVYNKIFGTIIKSLPIFLKSNKFKIKEEDIKKNSNYKYIIRGILLLMPMLFIIMFLLCSSDMLFEKFFYKLLQDFYDVRIKKIVGHVFVVFMVAIYLFALFFRIKHEKYTEYFESSTDKKETIKWNYITVATIIIGINLVYLSFSIVQFSYLYGGGNGELPLGVSYAEYARKGFFELILITLINFLIVLCCKFFTEGQTKKTERFCNVLYTIMIGFTYNILFSAYYRMNLYESKFGYTRLRVLVEAFIFLLTIILIVVLFRIWKKSFPIVKYITIITFSVYVVLNYANIDRIIVQKNVERYKVEGKLDISYINKLSYDSYFEMAKLLDMNDKTIKTEVMGYFETHRIDLVGDYDKWYEFNYYKNKFKNYK